MTEDLENFHRKLTNLNDRELALSLLKVKKISVSQISKKLMQDKSFALEVVTLDGTDFTSLPKKLQKDIDIIKIAVRHYPMAIANANRSYLNDREFVKDILSKNGGMLGDKLLTKYRNDRELVATAIRNAGVAIIFASPALKNNIPFVLEAMKDDKLNEWSRRTVLGYLSSNIKNLCKDGDPLIMIQKHYDSYLLSKELNSELTNSTKDKPRIKI